MSRIARPGYLVAIEEPAKRPMVRLRVQAANMWSNVRRLSDFLNGRSSTTLLALGILQVAIVGLIDYFTGPELSFLPFYIVPVAFVTWYVGRRAGLLATVACSLVWAASYVSTESVDWGDAATYWNVITRMGIFFVVSLTLSVMRRALDREKELARTDHITGVANSRAYHERVEQTIFYSRRYKRQFTGAYIDVDNFKAVNDHFGHSTGDLCLRIVADTITANTRVTDFVARIAGDEFAILMPETNIDQANIVIDRLREKLLEEMRYNGWPATFSIGVATYVTPPATPDDLIKLSDDLMYSVKNNGKNGVRYEVYGDLQRDEQDTKAAS